MGTVKIELQKSFFGEKEKLLLQSGAFVISTFTYSTGVAALRVKNEMGELIWLPFKGQQIWRAEFCGRDLTMKSTFAEPADTLEFGASYGAFMLHCGMTSMGNPSPEDSHPQHGELPSIEYDGAHIIMGTDENGDYVELGGSVRYRRCFAVDYTARPAIRLYEKGTVMDIGMALENNRADPLEYLYLCHVNFKPVDGSKLVYKTADRADRIKIHKDIPESLLAPKAAKLADYMEILTNDPAAMDTVGGADQAYDPEIVFNIRYEADEHGWGHCRQITPDGSSDYVGFRMEELPLGIRWIARTGDEDAMGMCLPSTAEHKGLKYCRENGQIKTLPAGGKIVFRVKAGLIPRQF